MRKLTLTLSAAALALGGVAYAAPGMMHGGDMTRAEAEEKAVEMFARMDANDDGVLNEADREAHRNERFDRLDTDGDGSLSREEFFAKHGRMHGDDGKDGKNHRMGKRGDRHGKMMEKADSDNDGSVSSAEFTTAMLTRFDEADADNDGTVTKEERRSAWKSKREQWKQHRGAQDGVE